MKLLFYCSITFVFYFLSIASTNAQQAAPGYPKVTGYFSIMHPIGTFNKDGFHDNFSDTYTLVFPFGLNILKSDQFGVSFEIAPAVRTERNVSKTSSVLFHPGAMFRFKKGFTFIGRLAFETNGRIGITPVFNQVIKKGKDASIFLSVPFPIRFGNEQPVSLTTGLQLGVSF
ncbi:MAG: hypothetical protein V4581_00280 [Bacteroidota bacterium]